MGMATLFLTIRSCDVSQLEEPAIAALPVRDRALRVAVAAPEEVTRVRLWTRRDIHKILDHKLWKRNVHRCSGLGLIEQEAVAVQAVTLKRDGVADAQPAPSHQQRQSTEPSARGLDVDEPAAGVTRDVSRRDASRPPPPRPL